MSNSQMLQAAARRNRDEFMRTAAELRVSLAPTEVAKDISAHFRSHPTSLGGLVRPSTGQAILTVAVVALGRLLKQAFGRRLRRPRGNSRNT